MFGWERVAGGFALIVGLSLMAGFITQFRDRGYVGWLGGCFLCLAAAGFIWQSSPQFRSYLLGAAGLAFLIALVSSVLHTRVKLQEISSRQEAFEAQMLAMLEIEKAKHQKQKESENKET